MNNSRDKHLQVNSIYRLYSYLPPGALCTKHQRGEGSSQPQATPPTTFVTSHFPPASLPHIG